MVILGYFFEQAAPQRFLAWRFFSYFVENLTMQSSFATDSRPEKQNALGSGREQAQKAENRQTPPDVGKKVLYRGYRYLGKEITTYQNTGAGNCRDAEKKVCASER